MMDESMIGRVAEAIRLRGIDRGHPVQPVVLRHLAVAAIEAMREPLDQIIDAGREVLCDSGLVDFGASGSPLGCEGSIAADIYRAMIDAALSEKP